MDLRFFLHYPFSKKAKEYAIKENIVLTERIIEKAKQKLNDAAVDGKIKRSENLDETLVKEELGAYAACRMILSALGNRYLINRYAVAESKKARYYFDLDEEKNPEFVEEISSEFGLKFEKSKDYYLLDIFDYLFYMPNALEYKLVNKKVISGKVLLKANEKKRILEEAVKKKIESELPLKANFDKKIQEAAKEIEYLIPKIKVSVNADEKNFPPCIKKLIEDLYLNINLQHNARVALAIYLINAGLDDEKIVEIFKNAPDFSEKVTRYQINFIRKKKYNMPSCSTMDSWGLCVAECRCGNPLKYKEEVHGKRLKKED